MTEHKKGRGAALVSLLSAAGSLGAHTAARIRLWGARVVSDPTRAGSRANF